MLGHRLYLTNLELKQEGDLFDPGSDSDLDINPDLTWSMSRQEYLLVWSDWYDGPSLDYFRAAYSMIFESEQGDGVSEIKSGAYWVIDPLEPGHDSAQQFPVVAFNNLSGRYLVAFQEDAGGLDRIIGVLLEGGSRIGDPFQVAEDVYEQPAVAYSGGATGAMNALDEFMVVAPVLGAIDYRLQGTYVWMSHLSTSGILITPASGTNLFQEPAITGNPQNGNYLVVWEEVDASGYDIYGQRYDNGEYLQVFQPLIRR